jgi:hypothetical protein
MFKYSIRSDLTRKYYSEGQEHSLTIQFEMEIKWLEIRCNYIAEWKNQ